MASTKIFSVLLILSLFSLTSATFINPAAIGEAYKYTTDIMTNPKTIALAKETVITAKEAGVNVLNFMSTAHGEINSPATIKCMDTCKVTIGVAVKELAKSVMVMESKTFLTVVELRTIQRSVNLSAENAVKCNASCKQTKAHMQVMFNNQLDQFIKVSKIAVKATSIMADAA